MRRVAVLVAATLMFPYPAGASLFGVHRRPVQTVHTRTVSTTRPQAVRYATAPVVSPEDQWLASAAAQCVELHESSTVNGKTLNPLANGNIWQFEYGQWTYTTGLTSPPGASSAAVQNKAAYELYLQRRWQPWQADDYWCKRYE